ncbi:MAG: mechanosensitive ion channel family protein, partial [Clostridia bacterium]
MEGFTKWLQELGTKILPGILKIVLSLIVFFVLCKILNIFFRKLDKAMEKKKVEVTVRRLTVNWTRRVCKFLLVIGVIAYLGIDTSGIAAAIASIGLAIGLALQGSLSNFAGGVVIVVMHPYRVGDFIECKQYSGTVEDIELFHTVLCTPDNKTVIIPNSLTANSEIVNYSRKDTRRCDMNFSISYDTDIVKVKSVLAQVLDECDLVLKAPAPFINISEHSADAITMLVRFYAKSDDFWNAKFYLLEAVKVAFDNNGIDIPFQQIDVHLCENNALSAKK